MALTRHRVSSDGDYTVERDGEVVARIRRVGDAGAPSVAAWDWKLTPEAAAQADRRADGWEPTLRDAVAAVGRALEPRR